MQSGPASNAKTVGGRNTAEILFFPGSRRASAPSAPGRKNRVKVTHYNQKTKARKKFQKRAGIEPVIGHLKSDHRMMRNFLKGTRGDVINTLMAAAYNMRHWMNKSKPPMKYVY